MANLCEQPLEELLPAILKLGHIQISLLKFTFPPQDRKKFRAHAEYIDLEFIKPFLHVAKNNHNFDIMIESKQKDLALFRLIDELSAIRGIKRISGAMLQW